MLKGEETASCNLSRSYFQTTHTPPIRILDSRTVEYQVWKRPLGLLSVLTLSTNIFKIMTSNVK